MRYEGVEQVPGSRFEYVCKWDRYYFGYKIDEDFDINHECFTYSDTFSTSSKPAYTGELGECRSANTPSMCQTGNPSGANQSAVENVSFVHNWRSPRDGRFNFERHYRSDVSDRYFRGRSQHGGSWGTLWDEVIDNKSSHFASKTGSDWVYFARDGSQTLFSNTVSNGYRHSRRGFETEKIKVVGSERILEDGSGVVKTFEHYNPASTNGHTSYLKEVKWPDGYTITVDRVQSQGELIVQSITDNKGQRAEYTWRQQSLGYRTKDIVSQINVDTDYDGVTFQPDVQIDYEYAVADLSTSVNHERHRAITLTRTTTTEIATSAVLSDYHYDYTRSNPSFLPLLTAAYQGDPTQPSGWQQIASYQYSDEFGRPASIGKSATVGQTTISLSNATYDALLTNPLGKETGVDFTTIQGVKRPTQFTGVATPNCLGTVKSVDYTPNAGAPQGYVYERIERNGSRTTFERDSRGLVLTKTEDADGLDPRVTTYTWHADLRLPLSRTTAHLLETFTYDVDGLMTSYSQTDVLAGSPNFGEVRTWTYTHSVLPTGLKVLTALDGPGLLSDGVTDVTTFAYNADGTIASYRNEVGLITEFQAYDSYGNASQIKLPDETTWLLTFDAAGRLIGSSETYATNTISHSYSYDLSGNILSVTDGTNDTWAFEYDDTNRLTSIIAPNSDRVNYSYDSMGNVTRQEFTDGSSAVTFFEDTVFDELGRLSSALGAHSQSTSFAYDEEDNLTSTIDANNLVESNSYDALNRLTQNIDRAGHVTDMQYDEDDQLVEYTDQRAIDTNFTYNGFGEVVAEVSADRGTLTYERDSRGLVTSMTDARGIVTSYFYDDAGRQTKRSYPGSNHSDLELFWDQNYIGASAYPLINNGSLGRVSYNAIRTDFREVQYVTERRVTVKHVYPGYKVLIPYFIQDKNQRLIRVELPTTGHEIIYERDSLGRVVNVRFDDGVAIQDVVSNITYLPNGPLTSMTYGDGSTQALGYDQSYRLISTQDSNGANTLRSLTYGYDALDDLTSITDLQSSANNEAFGYSNRQFLASANGAYGSRDYLYDAVGNRLSLTIDDGSGVDTHAYTYPIDSNRLQTISSAANGTRSLVYDAAGNVTYDARSGAGYGYSYDASGRMESFSIDGVVQAEYKYNWLGQQAIREYPQTGEKFYTVFGWDGNRMSEVDGNTGSVLTEYIWLDGRPIGVYENGTLYFVRSDHIGRPVFATDATGTKVWEASYLPFGGVHVSTGDTLDLRFPGQWFQTESGLHQNWMRDYDPTTGRYIQADPLGLIDGSSVYGYAMQSPNRYVDPMGLETTVIAWEPVGWGSSSFGHVSITINGISFSFGPGGMSVEEEKKYTSRQSFRDGFGRPLSIMPLDEARLAICLLKDQGEYSVLYNSCTDPIERCLATVGIDIGDSYTPLGLMMSLRKHPAADTNSVRWFAPAYRDRYFMSHAPWAK